MVKTLSGHSDKVSRVDISPDSWAPIKVLTKREMLELKREEREREENQRRAEAGLVGTVKSEEVEVQLIKEDTERAQSMDVEPAEQKRETHQLAEVRQLQ